MNNVDKERALIVLSGIFTASLIASNLLGSRLLGIFNVTVSLGLFVFPFTYLSADIITELFGKETALKVVRCGIVLQVYVLLFVILGGLLPGSIHRNSDEAYRIMFGLTPRMVFASLLAYTVSQILDVKVFSYLKESSGVKSVVLRANAAAYLSQLVDTVIFMGIFLGGVLPFPELLKTGAVSYVTKLLVTTFHSPLVKLGIFLLGARKNVAKA
jgi:uncharacterized integral membrane protein (TIGR00697 family)